METKVKTFKTEDTVYKYIKTINRLFYLLRKLPLFISMRYKNKLRIEHKSSMG